MSVLLFLNSLLYSRCLDHYKAHRRWSINTWQINMSWTLYKHIICKPIIFLDNYTKSSCICISKAVKDISLYSNFLSYFYAFFFLMNLAIRFIQFSLNLHILLSRRNKRSGSLLVEWFVMFSGVDLLTISVHSYINESLGEQKHDWLKASLGQLQPCFRWFLFENWGNSGPITS